MGLFDSIFGSKKEAYKDGMKDATKPLSEKINDVDQKLSSSNQEMVDNMANVKNAVESINDTNQKITETIDKTNNNIDMLNKNQQESSENIKEIIDQLTDEEREQVYQLNTKYNISELDGDERKYLIGLLITISDEYGSNGIQKKYIKHLQGFLSVPEFPMDIQLGSLDNIENTTTQKIYLQTVVEFFYLSRKHEIDEEVMDYFSVSSKSKHDVMNNTEKIVRAVGLNGLIEKYGLEQELSASDKMNEARLKEEQLAKQQAAFRAEKRRQQEELKKQEQRIREEERKRVRAEIAREKQEQLANQEKEEIKKRDEMVEILNEISETGENISIYPNLTLEDISNAQKITEYKYDDLDKNNILAVYENTGDDGLFFTDGRVGVVFLKDRIISNRLPWGKFPSKGNLSYNDVEYRNIDPERIYVYEKDAVRYFDGSREVNWEVDSKYHTGTFVEALTKLVARFNEG